MISITIKEELGKGAYGSIYTCRKGSEELAVKKCAIKGNGIFNLVEAAMMCSFQHPYLNNCKDAYITENDIYLVQEKCVEDFSCFLLRNQKSYRNLPQDNLIKWAWQLTKAVQLIHHYGLIHCDIKTKNILIDSENNFKLSDFGLSMISIGENFEHITGTPNHTPLENFLDLPIDQKFDIWSLGCCFHEIFFGYSLFPKQSENNHQKYVNCILDWSERGLPFPTDKKYQVLFKEISFVPFSLSPYIKLNEEMKNLIYSCLRLEPENRPLSGEILKNKLFTNFPSEIEYLFHQSENKKLEEFDQNLLKNTLRKFNENYSPEKFSKLSSFYSVIPDFLANQEEKAALSLFFFAKMTYKIKLRNEIIKQNPNITELERRVCTYLNFRLFT